MTDQKYEPFTKEQLESMRAELPMKAELECAYRFILADGSCESVDFEVMGRFLATIDAAQNQGRKRGTQEVIEYLEFMHYWGPAEVVRSGRHHPLPKNKTTPKAGRVEHIPTVFCDSPPCSKCGTVTISEDTLWRCPNCGGTEAKGGG